MVTRSPGQRQKLERRNEAKGLQPSTIRYLDRTKFQLEIYYSSWNTIGRERRYGVAISQSVNQSVSSI